MADQPIQSKLDTVTGKYAESFEQFSSSKSGNVILDFVMFRKNIVPYTLQILYVFGIVVALLVGVLGIVGQGPIGDVSKDFLGRTLLSLAVIAFSPFVLHYALEVLKYVFLKVAVPIWDKVVIRFFVNVMPEMLPFLFERFMKFIDILLDGIVVKIMAVAAVLKGVVWLPKTLCQRLSRWANKPLDGEK